MELFNDSARSPQLVTGRRGRNKRAALSILPANKRPLSPATPGTAPAVTPQIHSPGFHVAGGLL